MSKIVFSDKDISILSKNKYVKSVSSKSITYTNEFKIYFISESKKGKSSRLIFKEAGFDIDIIGIRRVESAGSRWRKAYNDKGITGLDDTRRSNTGRTRKRPLTDKELIQRQSAQIEYLKAEVELLKKLDLEERQVRSCSARPSIVFKLIYNVINKFKLKNAVSYLCSVTGVSRSGYYAYLNSFRVRNRREELDIQSKKIILKAFNRHGFKKGSRSIKMILSNEFGIVFNRKRIQRIMRKYNIVCPHRKPNPYKRIAKATKEHRIVPNLLNRNFKQNIPCKVLLTDITYLPYKNSSMAYLSTIKDASTNEILAYNVSDTLGISIVTNTINKLISNPNLKLAKDAFIHSDQGSHYTSPIFQKILKKYNIEQSMSRRGNCWDNAPQESFFGHMKDDLKQKQYTSFKELKNAIDKYMNYYNNYRCQWNLKKLTPVQYRNQLLAA